MIDRETGSSLLDGDLRAFFGRALKNAAQNQKMDIPQEVFGYVVELLVQFHETANLFVQEGVRVPVLADMLMEALEADFHKRVSLLRHMGDTSLMVTGYFPEALSRRCVDFNYYQSMGETAYSHLGALTDDLNIFDKLSERFLKVSELINEVSEMTLQRHDSVNRLLDAYIQLGSERAYRKLKEKGLYPFKARKKGRLIL